MHKTVYKIFHVSRTLRWQAYNQQPLSDLHRQTYKQINGIGSNITRKQISEELDLQD